jgi:hypothetical protein
MLENTEIQKTAKQLRQEEVDAYQKNIDVYKKILETLDGDWDEDLVHLKTLDPHEAARQCSLDRLERLAALQQFEQFSNLLKTEIVEHAKAKAILNIL